MQTVRTVALIGGEESLSLLAGYVGDRRESVIRTLIHSWDYFDADSYVDSILSRLSLAGHEVRLNHSGQLQAASRLRSMERIAIGYPVRDFAFLDDFPPLKQLWVTAVRAEADLTPLRRHSELEEVLIFEGGPLTGAGALLELPKLEWLATPAYHDMNLEELRLLPNLQLLSLNEKTERDLAPLASLAGLRHLHLIWSNKSSTPQLHELRQMADLRDIMFFGVHVCDWLSALKSAPPLLRNLTFTQCVVPTDHRDFAMFEKLERLSLLDCVTREGERVTSFDFPGVRVRVTT